MGYGYGERICQLTPLFERRLLKRRVHDIVPWHWQQYGNSRQ